MIEEMTADDLASLGKRWCKRIREAEDREKDWITAATNAEAAYLCDDSETTERLPDFNILHSNVETIVPSIINSNPIPDIRPRHLSRREDPIAKGVSDIYERVISTMVDDNKLDREMERSAQDALMAGRGVVRIKFDADDDMDEFGQPIVTNERLVYEVVSWRDYRQGPSKRWPVPWVAYRHEVSEDDLNRIEDPEIMDKYPKEDAPEDLDATIWEIWDRENRVVLFVTEDSEKVIAIKDDPLGLPGFFPQAEPVQPITGTANMTPVCPYEVYRRLAEELDRITRRINGIMKGLKVRGIIVGAAGDISNLAEADDNELVPIANIENLVAAGGLDKAIAWWPVEQAINVLQQLYQQREMVKQTIYEVTGISDIVRGSSKSSETATAQQIKAEWGSLRVKKLQSLIQRQVRGIFVISAHLISMHFSFATLQKISGIQIAPEMQELLGKPLDHYRIDVETDSTIRSDLTKSRSEMADFLRVTGEFFGAMAPVVQGAPQSAGPLAKMYAAFASQFNLGRNAEEALDQFVMLAEQAAKQPRKDPEAEMAKAQMDMQMKDNQAKTRLEVEKLALQRDNLKMDLSLKGQQLKLDEAKAEVDAAARLREMEMEEQQERAVRFGQ